MTEHLDEDRVSNFIPLMRFGEPEEVAHLAYFLTTATYITGQVLSVFYQLISF